jgi:hypothetical protein
MKRIDWEDEVRRLENRDKEITAEYDAKVKEVNATYEQQKGQWSNERDEARGDVIAEVPGGTDRLEYAQRTLEALEKGHAKKLDELEHECEFRRSENEVELQELHANAPLVEKVIDSAEIVVELAKFAIERSFGVELPPVDLGGYVGWEVAKDAARMAVDKTEQLLETIMDSFEGDPQTPREEKLEHWIDEAQHKFDEKFKDAPAQERETMQDNLDHNFDLLRAALERQQERQQRPDIEPEDPHFGP